MLLVISSKVIICHMFPNFSHLPHYYISSALSIWSHYIKSHRKKTASKKYCIQSHDPSNCSTSLSCALIFNHANEISAAFCIVLASHSYSLRVVFFFFSFKKYVYQPVYMRFFDEWWVFPRRDKQRYRFLHSNFLTIR